MSKNKLEKLIAQKPHIRDEILEARTAGKSFRLIAEELKAKYGISVSAMGIKKFIDRTWNNEIALAKHSELFVKVSEESAQKLNETIDELNAMKMKLWDLLDRLEKSGQFDTKDIVVIMGEIRKQIELQNKLLGNIANATKVNINQNINVVDISVNITKILKTMEDKGYIKILKELPETVPL